MSEPELAPIGADDPMMKLMMQVAGVIAHATEIKAQTNRDGVCCCGECVPVWNMLARSGVRVVHGIHVPSFDWLPVELDSETLEVK